MTSYETSFSYLKKTQVFYFITKKLVSMNDKLDKHIDYLNSFFQNFDDKDLSSDKIVFFEPMMQEKYGKFLKNTVEHFETLFCNKEFEKINSIPYVLDYFMEFFDFSYKFEIEIHKEKCIRNIGIFDADAKELFVRRRLDMFPFYIKESCLAYEVRMMYYYFVMLFCYDYSVSCCENFVKLLDKGTTVKLTDALECIIANEKSNVQVPIDYVFMSDASMDYYHLVFRNIGSLQSNINYNKKKLLKK